MGGGAVWGQSDGRTYVTCMVNSVGVRRNKITGVLTVRLREGGGEERKIRYQKQPGHLSVLTHQRSMQYYET